MSEAAAFELTFPEAESTFVKQTYAAAQGIIEYGSGGSTMLAAELGAACVSAESDAEWAARLNGAIADKFDGKATARAVHVDIGPTVKWGFPKRALGWKKYWKYPTVIWDEPESAAADVVLIDGRFRAACFAMTLMRIQRPTRILFDDYADRDYYHKVEAFAEPEQIIGRMASFNATPGMLMPSDIGKIMPWFVDPA